MEYNIAEEYKKHGGINYPEKIMPYIGSNMTAALLTVAPLLKSIADTLQRLEEKFYGKS